MGTTTTSSSSNLTTGDQKPSRAASAVGNCCRVSARMLEIADDGAERSQGALARIHQCNAGQAALLREAANLADDMLAALKIALNEVHHPGACSHENSIDVADFLEAVISKAERRL